MACFEKGCYFSSLLPILFLLFEKRGRKALWNLSKRCGLGWACMGASVPKNGNNRPLSLPLENFFPKLLSCTAKLSASSFLDYVIGRLLPVESELEGIKEKVCRADVRCEQQTGILQSSEDTISGCYFFCAFLFFFKLFMQ